MCKPHKRWSRKGAKNAQYEKPAVRRRIEKGKESGSEDPVVA